VIEIKKKEKMKGTCTRKRAKILIIQKFSAKAQKKKHRNWGIPLLETKKKKKPKICRELQEKQRKRKSKEETSLFQPEKRKLVLPLKKKAHS